MAVVACIDAMFNTHTHTPLEYHGKNTVIDSNICRVSWKKAVMAKGVIEKVSWIGVMETVKCAASWKGVTQSDTCGAPRNSRHGKRNGKH